MYSKHLLRKLGNWHTTRLIQKNIAQRSRRHFSKMLESNGAIRIQGSVYEIQNTKRIVDNIKIKIITLIKSKLLVPVYVNNLELNILTFHK